MKVHVAGADSELSYPSGETDRHKKTAAPHCMRTLLRRAE